MSSCRFIVATIFDGIRSLPDTSVDLVVTGRDAVGIDLDPRNADLARERVGMFLTIEHLEEAIA